MSNVPADLKYTKSHEWVRLEADGSVTAVNEAVVDAPETLNQDAYAAWLFKLQPANAGDLGALLDAAAYGAVADSE